MVFYQIFRSTSMRFLGWLSSVLGCWPWILLQFKNINFYYDLLSSLDSSCSVRYHKGSLPSRRSSCLVLPSIIAPTFTSIQLFRIELLTEIQNHVMKSMHENFVGEGSFSNNMMTIHSKQNYRSTYEQMGRTQYCLLFQFAVLVMFHFIFSEE